MIHVIYTREEIDVTQKKKNIAYPTVNPTFYSAKWTAIELLQKLIPGKQFRQFNVKNHSHNML